MPHLPTDSIPPLIEILSKLVRAFVSAFPPHDTRRSSSSTTTMPSDLNQKLYLGVLPDGLKFTIKSITPTVPNRDGWLASFSNPDAGSISSGPNVRFSCPRPTFSLQYLAFLYPDCFVSFLGRLQHHQISNRNLDCRAGRVHRGDQAHRRQRFIFYRARRQD